MSKLTHNSIWARAGKSSASTNVRASSVLTTKSTSRQNASNRQQSLVQANAEVTASASVAGAVSAPYYGPQPAGAAELWDQLGNTEPSLQSSVTSSNVLSAAIQNNFLLSAPMLRSAGFHIPTSLHSTRLCRPLHVWSGATEAALSNARLPIVARHVKQIENGSGSLPAGSETVSEQYASVAQEAPEEVVAALMASMSLPAHAEYEVSRKLLGMGSISMPLAHEDISATSTTSVSPPRSPSPGRSHRRTDSSGRSTQGWEASPTGLGTSTSSAGLTQTGYTTSSTPATSQYSLSSSSQASTSSSTLASSSSAASSTSSLPPSESDNVTSHWVKAFNVPRSSKRHDFMFEHGAYGIPKRHPLSSIYSRTKEDKDASRKEGRDADGSTVGKGKQKASDARGSRQDITSTSKVRAAADMLSAAADFLAGPQTPGMASSKEKHRPMRGDEALNMAFSGGSTADGHELHNYAASGARRTRGGKTNSQSKHSKMAIRGDDGRIIKDRLRSVQVGEDAYFLRPDSLGVADGVGGWASRPGADPALFSRLLMHFCAVELSRYDDLSATDLAADNGNLLNAWAGVDPVEVMHRAWERCVRASRREGILGSSTALLALLRGDELRIANVGDCVLMIIRKGEMLFRSTEQQHSFNFPVQLGMMGDNSETLKTRTEAANKARAAGEGEVTSEHMEDYDDVEDVGSTAKGTSHQGGGGEEDFEKTIDGAAEKQQGTTDSDAEWDEPRRDAGRWSVRVEAGDIIVVGSDGLMDNLFDEDIIEEVLRFVPTMAEESKEEDAAAYLMNLNSSNFSPQLVSEALCSRAKAISEDSRAVSSPFQQRAMEEGLHYVGGKHDDISVLVCLVGEREGGEATLRPDGSQSPSAKCLVS